MAKKLDFKDFLTVDYAPGMPDLIKKNAKKRKMDSGAGTNAEYSSRYSPEDQIDTIDEVSQALGHKVAKARQAQASSLRQKAIDEPDMMKAFAHTRAANKAEKKAGQSYNRLMKKEEVELDEYNTKSSKAIVRKDNKPIAIYPDLKSAQKDYHGKDGHDIGMRSHSAAMRIKKENPGIKIVEETEDVDEALNLQQRRARGRKMKLKRRQIEVSRKRVLKRAADPKRLKSRAQKAARNAIFRRLAKGLSRSEVPPQRRQEIEKRMEKMKGRIERLAVKLTPKVRKLDKERRATKEDNK